MPLPASPANPGSTSAPKAIWPTRIAGEAARTPAHPAFRYSFLLALDLIRLSLMGSNPSSERLGAVTDPRTNTDWLNLTALRKGIERLVRYAQHLGGLPRGNEQPCILRWPRRSLTSRNLEGPCARGSCLLKLAAPLAGSQHGERGQWGALHAANADDRRRNGRRESSALAEKPISWRWRNSRKDAEMAALLAIAHIDLLVAGVHSTANAARSILSSCFGFPGDLNVFRSATLSHPTSADARCLVSGGIHCQRIRRVCL